MSAPLLDTPRGRLAAWRPGPVALAGAVAVALVIVGELVSPGFAGYGQLVNLMRVAAFLGVIAIGQTIVIIAGGGGVDLSVGKVATFSAIIGSRVMAGDDANIVPAVALSLLVAAAIGLVNGLGVTLLRIPPFVMTLGMIGVVQGLILAYTGGQAEGRAAPALTSLVNGRVIFDLPGLLFLWLLLGLLAVWLLRRTTFGWNLFAVGANRTAASLTGVRVNRTLILAYVLSATFAGLAGILLLGYTESVFLDLADQYMLPSVAAVVIGGTLLAGGIGGYAGTAVGAIVLTVLQGLLTTLDIGGAWRTVVNGVVLLVLLSLYGRQRRLRS
ncbi:ABC transporter permease [Jiangella muralis]|uniref:ABC transporter permease n=1 Tax=Jiangella muralis TaxID=702383 RepID=UPI00069F0C67|nr:ABC transporter permease [Jiangella muralis]